MKISIYIQAVLANVFWGFSFVWTDIALKAHIAPVTLVMARMAIATVLLGAWAKYSGNLQKINKTDFKYFVGLAICEPFLYFLFETYGQTMVSPTVTSVIVATIPLFTSLVGFLALKERVTLPTVAGIALSMAGVLGVVFAGASNLSGQFIGALLVFGAVAAALGYAVFVKYIVQRYNATTLVFYQNLLALVYFIPCFFAVDFAHLSEMRFTFDALAAIVQLSVLASVVAFIFYSRAVKALGVTRAGVFCYLIPVLTALFAFVVTDEKLTALQWISMAVVILGLFVSQIAGRKSI